MPNHWIAAVLVTLSFYLHHRCTMSGYVGLRHCAYIVIRKATPPTARYELRIESETNCDQWERDELWEQIALYFCMFISHSPISYSSQSN